MQIRNAEVGIVRIGPRDRVLVKVRERCTPDEISRIKRAVISWAGCEPDQVLVIQTGAVDVQILKNDLQIPEVRDGSSGGK